MSTLADLEKAREAGLAPIDGVIYFGIGFRPPKLNAIEIDPNNLPSQAECYAIAGIDAVLVFHGDLIKYGTLRTLAERLYQSRPRRLQLIDIDHKRTAFLKLAGVL